jgi:ABC-type maltose transport system permease subunit
MKINFGGKDRGFQWGMGCIEKYCDFMGGDLETLAELDGKGIGKIKASVTLLLSAMINYAELNDEVIDYNYAKVASWLDEADQDTMNVLMADFIKSKFLGKTIQDYFELSQAEGPATSAVKKKSR